MEIYYNCSYTGSPVGFIPGRLQYVTGQSEDYVLSHEQIPLLIQRCFDFAIVRKACGRWRLTGSDPVYFLLVKGLTVDEGQDERGIDKLSEYYLNFALTTTDRSEYEDWLAVEDDTKETAETLRKAKEAMAKAVVSEAIWMNEEGRSREERAGIIREKLAEVMKENLPENIAGSMKDTAAAEELVLRVEKKAAENKDAGELAESLEKIVRRKLSAAEDEILQKDIALAVKDTLQKDRGSDFGFTVKAAALERLTRTSFGILLPDGQTVCGPDLDEEQIYFELWSAGTDFQNPEELLGLADKGQQQKYTLEPLDGLNGWFCYHKKKIAQIVREGTSGTAAAPPSGTDCVIRAGNASPSVSGCSVGNARMATRYYLPGGGIADRDTERIVLNKRKERAAKIVKTAGKAAQQGAQVYRKVLEPSGKKFYKKILKPGGKALLNAAECGVTQIVLRVSEAGQKQDYRKKPGSSSDDT